MSLITTIEEYNTALKRISELDLLILQSYSYIQKIPSGSIEEIIEIQNLINNAKKQRLGNYNLTKMYEVEFSNEKEKDNVYIVKLGDTLPFISFLKYGRQDRWQYIYDENGLTDTRVEPNTELIIPKLPEPVDPFIMGEEIFCAEFTALYVEKVLHEK